MITRMSALLVATSLITPQAAALPAPNPATHATNQQISLYSAPLTEVIRTTGSLASSTQHTPTSDANTSFSNGMIASQSEESAELTLTTHLSDARDLGQLTRVVKNSASHKFIVGPAGNAIVVDATTGSMVAAMQAPQALDKQGKRIPLRYAAISSTEVRIENPVNSALDNDVKIQEWWGRRIVLDNEGANQFAALLGAVAGGTATQAAACAVITGGSGVLAPLVPLCVAGGAITAGLFGIGAAAVAYCNAGGRGIILYAPWTGGFWCKSR